MRRVVVLAAAVLVAAVALVAIGRWERGQRASEENAGMHTVVQEVGPIGSPSLRGFRILANFDCLVYRRGRVPYALELCIDDEGRLVEAIDRRSGEPHIWSLRDDPTRASVRFDRREVDRLLDMMGVPDRLLPTRTGDA
jgi:hypothetical protein